MRVPIKPKFTNNEWTFIDKPPLPAGAPTVGSMAPFNYNELQHRTTGQYKIILVRPNTIVVDANGVHDTVSIQLVSNALKTTPSHGEDTVDTLAKHAVTPNNQRTSDHEHEYAIEQNFKTIRQSGQTMVHSSLLWVRVRGRHGSLQEIYCSTSLHDTGNGWRKGKQKKDL